MSFRKLHEPPEYLDDSFEQVVLRGMVLHNRKPSLYGKWGEIHREEAKIKIKDDEIMILCKDKELTQPITINIGSPPQARAVLITSVQGGGKSGLAKTLMNQLKYKGFKFFCIETKDGYDFPSMAKAQDDPRAFPFFNRFGLMAQGYKIKEIIPDMVADRFTKVEKWKLDVPDFNSLPKALRMFMWCSFLGIKEFSGPAGILKTALSMNPKNTDELLDCVGVAIKRERIRRKEIGIPGVPSSKLLRILEQKIETNELGTRTKKQFSFIKTLADNDMVVLHAPFSSKNLVTMNVYISIAINQIISDRNTYVKTDGKRGLMSQPPCFVLEEADSLIGRGDNNLAKHVIYDIPARYRHIGAWLIAITQNPNYIDPGIIRLCSLIFTTQVTSPETRDLLRLRGIPRYLIDNQLNKLEWDSKYPTKEWGCLEPDKPGEVHVGRPGWPENKILKPGESINR